MKAPRAGIVMLGAALLECSRQLARRPGISGIEEQVFRVANDANDDIRVPVRTVMQAGTFGAVPGAAAIALRVGRRRLATELAIGGTAAWLLAKQVKPLGGRPRPDRVLEHVRIREGIEGNLGWVSGHAAVSTTLAMVAAPTLPRSTWPLLGSIVAVTGFGRMYVGAHLPLDVVGGVGLGLLVSAAVRTARGGRYGA